MQKNYWFSGAPFRTVSEKPVYHHTPAAALAEEGIQGFEFCPQYLGPQDSSEMAVLAIMTALTNLMLADPTTSITIDRLPKGGMLVTVGHIVA